MSVVSNTGPLIALAKVDQLELLAKLFGHIYIPPVVHHELLAKTGVETVRLETALLSFIHVTCDLCWSRCGHWGTGSQTSFLTRQPGRPERSLIFHHRLVHLRAGFHWKVLVELGLEMGYALSTQIAENVSDRVHIIGDGHFLLCKHPTQP
jgi:hypothetical protein